MENKVYSPTEPPTSGVDPEPINTNDFGANLGNDDISTNPCLNNLNEILKSFIDNLKNDERVKYNFLAELLENADLPLNTKVNSILQIINVMKKQAEEKNERQSG